MTEMKTKTYSAKSQHEANGIATALIFQSRWFESTPLPDDRWEFKVKAESAPDMLLVMEPAPVGPGNLLARTIELNNKLTQLLDDPHPGLSTWHEAVARVLKQLGELAQ